MVEKITNRIDKEQGKEPLSSDVDMKVKIASDYLTKWQSRNQLKNEHALQSPKRAGYAHSMDSGGNL